MELLGTEHYVAQPMLNFNPLGGASAGDASASVTSARPAGNVRSHVDVTWRLRRG